MVELKEGLEDEWVQLFFEEINKTSMKRSDFKRFAKAYKARDVVLSLWDDDELIVFGSMLTDWNINSIIYDVVVVQKYQKQGFGKRMMLELMNKAPETRFHLTSTVGNEDFYKKLGYEIHTRSFEKAPTVPLS